MRDLLPPEDEKFIQGLLKHGKIDLALEVLCDQLLDHRVYISERQGREIQELASERNLLPEYSWEFLVVYDQWTGAPKRLLREHADTFEVSIQAIIDEVKDCINSKTLSLIREFLESGEIVLCVETLFDCIVEKEIKLSRHSYDELIDLAIACHFTPEDTKKLKKADASPKESL